GYVEFKVEFYQASTTTKVIQNLIPVTCIDVDGKGYEDGVLYEQDQVQFFPGYYDYTMTGGNLLVNSVSNWMVIKNTSGISYPGIDTTAKDVMATVVNRNVSSFLLRIGALNTSSTESDVRYRSVYFKKFNYGHPEPLALKTILNLSGGKKQNGVELKVLLSKDHLFTKMVIERSASSSSSFSDIGEMNIAAGAGAASPLSYFDGNAGSAVNYYRVRLINIQTGKEELSNILMIKADVKNSSPEITTGFLQPANPVLAVRSREEGEANLQVFDMSGRSITKTKVRLNSGSNSISLPSFNAGRGYLVVVLETNNNQLISRKVLVQ
ncbi:MAG: T9SS type A sorting domain-containing protein, partial [Bacteroidota bacterium]